MLYRWSDRLHPFHQTGGPSRTTVVGVDMIHLVTFLFAYSDMTQDEMAAFIYNEGGTLYSNQRISERHNNLEITKKKASIEAFQVLDPEVQFRVYTYWNCPPPLRILRPYLQLSPYLAVN